MSKMMRPVQEIHGPATDLFVAPDEAIQVLRLAAALAGCYIEDEDYGEKSSVCVQQGESFLAFIEGGGFSAETLAASVETCAELDPGQLALLISNMKAHADGWRALVSPDDGSLTFYVDR